LPKYLEIEKKGITGIILAGGQSRRMGMEKGLVRLKDKTLIEYSIDVMKQLADRIIISSNSNVYADLGFEVFPDKIPNSGPMGGIYSCLCESKSDANLVLSCDTPFVNPGLFNYILTNSAAQQIVAPWHGGGFYEPLCAFYHKSTRKVFEKFIEDKNFRIPDVFKMVNFKALKMDASLDFYHHDLFFNINSKEELIKAKLI
jgi:molybdenum cofactor guanylyltransferase